MTRAKAYVRAIVALCAAVMVSGCDLFGAREVRVSREDYNDAVQTSTARQLLTNVVRVYDNETPLSMDVTGLIPTYTGNATLAGSLSGLGIGKKGGPFRMGSLTSGGLTSGLSYTQSLTAQYAPISGAALVQEFTTPITPDLIPKLVDSVVPTLPVLQFTVSRLTPRADDFREALNIISQLDLIEAIDIAVAPAANPSELQKPSIATKNLTVTVNDATTKQAQTPSLGIFFQPPRKCNSDEMRLWEKLLGLYVGTQSNITAENFQMLSNKIGNLNCGDGEERRVAEALNAIDGAKRIILSPTASNHMQRGDGGSRHDVDPRIFATYSAYGILRSIRESFYNPPEVFSIVSPDLYRQIRDNEPWNQAEGQVYTLLYKDICDNSHEPLKCSILPRDKNTPISSEASDLRKSGLISADEDNLNISIDGSIYRHYASQTSQSLVPLFYINDWDPDRWEKAQNNLGLRRRLILIQKSSDPPDHAFLSVERGGEYFFIGDHDEISQRNFALLGLLVAVQAVAPATPQATPTVPVGGR